jgi:glycosyltransferase involved in cell wall biosynthesis
VRRVWIFNHDACSPSTGPMLRHYNFAKYLEQMGYAVTIFASNRIHFNKNVIEVPEGKYIRLVENDVDFIRIKTPPYEGNGISRILNWYAYYRATFPISRELIRQGEKPDIIIGSSVHPLACFAANKIAKKYNIPSIVEIRDLWPEAIYLAGYAKENSLMGKVLNKFEHKMYKEADSIIFTKEGDKDHLIEMGWTEELGGDLDLKKCYYINNGVDLTVYNQQIQEEQITDSDLDNPEIFKVIYTGTIREMNNVDLILDAAKILQEKYQDLVFLLFGDGGERARLEKRLKDENINNVIFKGFVLKKHIPYILSKSNANILNYSQKNYNWKRGNSSNKLFEYMASGKPIISTVEMGYSPIKKYNCGIELEENTAESLVEGLTRLRSMPEQTLKQMEENALVAAKDFDFVNLSQKLSDVINRTVSEYEKKTIRK